MPRDGPPDPKSMESWKLDSLTSTIDISTIAHICCLSLTVTDTFDQQSTIVDRICPQIPITTVHWLQKNEYFPKGHFQFQVEGRCTKSPYEFYGRPLKQQWIDTPDGLDEGNAMIEANNELQSFVHELNTFYGDSNNRQLIDKTKTFVFL